MRNEDGKKEEIKKEIYNLRRESVEEYLEKIKGIDVEDLKKLHDSYTEKFEPIVEDLRVLGVEEADKSAEEQKEYMVRARPIRDDILVGKHLKCWDRFFTLLTTPLDQKCYEFFDPAKLKDNLDGDCSFVGNQGHAKLNLDVKGGGVGTTRKATIRADFKYAFTPTDTALYVINPTVLINGWYLLFTWATGCNTVTPGSGQLQIKLRIRVDQLSSNIYNDETDLVDISVNNDQKEGAINYVSDRDGDNNWTAYLQANHEAVIVIECEIHGEITNSYRAIIDMQSTDNLYFKIPFVQIYRRRCMIY